MDVESSKMKLEMKVLKSHTQEHYQRGEGVVTFIIRAKTSVTNVWFSMFLGQNYTNVASFQLCLHDNILNRLWKLVKQFGLNLMSIKNSNICKTLK
jgi:hypothetical protein